MPNPVVVVGTSISAASWLPGNAGIWEAVNARLHAEGLPPVLNRAVGGLAIRIPSTDARPALDHIKTVVAERKAAGDKPRAMILELGANDISAHQGWGDGGSNLDLGYCAMAADQIDAYLAGEGITPVWCTVLPVCNAFACQTPQPKGMRDFAGGGRLVLVGPGSGQSQLGMMTVKTKQWNDWLRAKTANGARVADIWEALGPASRDGYDGVGDPTLYLDGLHPTMTGSALIGAMFPLSTIRDYLT